jgi:hypothetical protein
MAPPLGSCRPLAALAGAEFEKRILGNEKNNVKFNFLIPTDPYHAYYKLRVSCMGERGEARTISVQGEERGRWAGRRGAMQSLWGRQLLLNCLTCAPCMHSCSCA